MRMSRDLDLPVEIFHRQLAGRHNLTYLSTASFSINKSYRTPLTRFALMPVNLSMAVQLCSMDLLLVLTTVNNFTARHNRDAATAMCRDDLFCTRQRIYAGR